MLTEIQRQSLLRIARSSIAAVLDGSQPELDASAIDDTLRKPAGA